MLFRSKKGEGYYICVLTISQNNCGHNLQLSSNIDTLKINTLHLPCSTSDKRLLSFLKIKEQKKDTTSPVVPSFEKISIYVRDISKASRKISGKVRITDELSGNVLKIDSSKVNDAKLVIEKGKKYIVECNATGYKKFNHEMIISEYVNRDSSRFIIYMKPLKAGDNLVMDNIYFYPNTYALKDESQDALDNLLEYLINNPGLKIELQGHTNGNNRCKKNKAYKDKGPEWNFSGSAKKLSLLRAEEIKKYLVLHGVNKNNIKTVGFGGDRMVVPNSKSPEALKKNVRVEMVIIEDGGL